MKQIALCFSIMLCVTSLGHRAGAVAYDFSGRVTSAGIDGTFKSFEPPSPRIIEEDKVSLKKLDTKILDQPQASGIYGQYSNMVYNQQSGDLNGIELIIIPGDHGPFGIFNTSDLGLTRYIMLNIRYAAGKFSFEVETQIGRSRYRSSEGQRSQPTKRAAA